MTNEMSYEDISYIAGGIINCWCGDQKVYRGICKDEEACERECRGHGLSVGMTSWWGNGFVIWGNQDCKLP